MAESKSTSGGIGLLGFVFLIFLVFKLTNTGIVANWSWWYVTAPLWAPALLTIVVLLIIGIVWLLAKLLTRKKSAAKYLRQNQSRKPMSSWQQKLNDMQEKHNQN